MNCIYSACYLVYEAAQTLGAKVRDEVRNHPYRIAALVASVATFPLLLHSINAVRENLIRSGIETLFSKNISPDESSNVVESMKEDVIQEVTKYFHGGSGPFTSSVTEVGGRVFGVNCLKDSCQICIGGNCTEVLRP